MKGFLIAAIVCACGALAIAWVRSRSKNRGRGESKRSVDQFRTPQVATSGAVECEEGTSDSRRSQPVAAPATADLSAPPITAAAGRQTHTLESATSAQPAESSSPLDGAASKNDNRAQAQPSSELLKQEISPTTEVVFAVAPTDLLEEARSLTIPVVAVFDPPAVTEHVRVHFELEQTAATETQLEPHSSLGLRHDGAVVPNIDSPPEMEVPTPPTHTDDGDTSGATVSRESAKATLNLPAASIVDVKPLSLPDPTSTEDNDIDNVAATVSASPYQPPRVRLAPPKRERKQTNSRRAPSEQLQRLSLIIKARIQQDYWSFSLIAQRPVGARQELEVECDSTVIQLIEAGNEWYETPVDGLADWLSGVVLIPTAHCTGTYQWQLTAREIHILASNSGGVSGWVSTTRLALGRKHIVLCSESRVDEVAAILKKGGCDDALQFGGDSGAPPGWILFWPVIPTRPLSAVVGDELLNLLRPLPGLEISLEGGLRLRSSTWLAGYPPMIIVAGVLPEGECVFVDGNVAARLEDGKIATPGYDTVGEHCVSVGGLQSRSYSVVEPELKSETWAAYEFPSGSICGALAKAATSGVYSTVTVPDSNPLLIGAEPGQVFLCQFQPGREWTVFPPFEAVWALPAVPLQSRKNSCHIVLLSPLPPKRTPASLLYKGGQKWRWIQAIRDTGRKGLALPIEDNDAERLWREYSLAARNLWRRAR